MIYGLYNSAAGMLVNEHRQSVIANNLANAETTGFKRDLAIFAEREQAALAGRRHGVTNRDLQTLTGGLWLGETFTDFSEGSKIQTGNPLDITIDGPGFLSVQAGGERLFTRDGRLMMDAHGRLVSVVDQAPVLGRGGAPIHLNRLGGQPRIDSDGRVFQDGVQMGELEIVDFANYATLRKVGDNRVAATAGGLKGSPARVQAGYTEASTVEPVVELVNMLDASRAYQINAEMVKLQDESLGRLINVIARQ